MFITCSPEIARTLFAKIFRSFWFSFLRCAPDNGYNNVELWWNGLDGANERRNDKSNMNKTNNWILVTFYIQWPFCCLVHEKRKTIYMRMDDIITKFNITAQKC